MTKSTNEQLDASIALRDAGTGSVIGANAKGNGLLCQAYGESERPCVRVVYDEDELRAWLVSEVGGPDAELDSIVDELRSHDWDEDADVVICYEIGGVSFSDVAVETVPRARELKEARAEIERLKSERKLFPIMQGAAVSFSLMLRFESQAQQNHNQSIKRLAERGGLTPGEALDVVHGRRWGTTRHTEAATEEWARWVKDNDQGKEIDRLKRALRMCQGLSSIGRFNEDTEMQHDYLARIAEVADEALGDK